MSRPVTSVIQNPVTFDSLNLHERAILIAFTTNKLIKFVLMFVVEKTAIANIAPDEACRILERTCDKVKLRANSNGECFGGEIMDSLREAGVELGANHVQILQTRGLLVRSMELLGECPAETLQDFENRIPLSTALRVLKQAIQTTRG